MSRAKIKQSRQIVELRNRVANLEESVEALGGIVKALVGLATGGPAVGQGTITVPHVIDGEIISLDTMTLNPPGEDSE